MKRILLVFFLFCNGFYNSSFSQEKVIVGAERFDKYLSLIQDKRVAVVANQTAVIGNTHLVDTLLNLGINVVKVFAPEHGFRGIADAGEHVENSKDKKTGLSIISLYGDNKKPKPSVLKDVDIIVFDIQDVGVRYYTYISSMHYVMEACVENGKQVIILDRPNPNGFYVDGPVLEMKYQSFVGMHPIPMVHGLTVGELAKMINNEGWLTAQLKVDLVVVPCENYTHDTKYKLPIKPSPNLPNMTSIYLYPSLGIFEGTIVSVGRGTDKPFQVIGHPKLQNTTYEFTPQSTEGAKNPPYKGELCKGFDLTAVPNEKMNQYGGLYLQWLKGTYDNTVDKENYFVKTGFFNLLAGTDKLRKQIEEGLTTEEITATWQKDLEEYKLMRKKYLLYPDFKE